MHRLRQTFDRMRHRHHDSVDGIDTKKKRRRFPKLPRKLQFLKKLRRDKHPKTDGVEKAETEVEIPIRSANSEDNILAKCQSGNDVRDVTTPVNGINNQSKDITISVECHDELAEADDAMDVSREASLTRLTPDRLSSASIGLKPFFRESTASRKSASNLSVASFRKSELRTVWTQTEMTESVAETQTSTNNLLTVPSCEENRSRLTSDDGSQFETPWTSMEFGVEELGRRDVENPVLAAYRDRVVRTLQFPNIDNAEPEVCVDLLHYAKVPYLSALNRKIFSETETFNEEFIAHRGLDYLLILMEEIANEGLTTLHDVTKMMLVSECATSLVNSESGRNFIIDHGEYIVSFARGKSFHHNSKCNNKKSYRGFKLTFDIIKTTLTHALISSVLSHQVNCSSLRPSVPSFVRSFLQSFIFSLPIH